MENRLGSAVAFLDFETVRYVESYEVTGLLPQPLHTNFSFVNQVLSTGNKWLNFKTFYTGKRTSVCFLCPFFSCAVVNTCVTQTCEKPFFFRAIYCADIWIKTGYALRKGWLSADK